MTNFSLNKRGHYGGEKNADNPSKYRLFRTDFSDSGESGKLRTSSGFCKSCNLSDFSSTGYTLIELVISVAMLAVVSSAILVLMVTGTRAYRHTKATVDLQEQTQTLEAQLETLIKEATYVNYDSSSNILKIYTPNDSARSGTGKDKDGNDIAVEYGSTEGTDLQVIKFNSKDNRLYFHEFPYAPKSGSGSGENDSGVNTVPSAIKSIDSSDNKDKNFMADYVTDIKADTSKVKKEGKVTITISMKHETDQFTDTAVFTMRNGYADPLATKTPDATSDATPTSTPASTETTMQ